MYTGNNENNKNQLFYILDLKVYKLKDIVHFATWQNPIKMYENTEL